MSKTVKELQEEIKHLRGQLEEAKGMGTSGEESEGVKVDISADVMVTLRRTIDTGVSDVRKAKGIATNTIAEEISARFKGEEYEITDMSEPVVMAGKTRLVKARGAKG